MVCDDLDFEIVVQVLHVVGYEFANETIVLRLTLDGHRLQTEKIFAKTDKVAVDTSISWTTKKGDIKRMKAENLPIKVECFRVRERGQFEAIGYVLIPLRTIPTCLYKNDEILPSPRWYKIYGVPGGVLHNKPELHLNVIIQPEQECLSASHLRGKFAEDEEDESFADPNVLQHFELKMDGENEVQQEIATPKIEEIQKAPASPEKIVEVAVEPPAQEKLIASTQTHPSNNNSQAKPTDPPIVDAELYTKKLEEWKNEEKDNFMAHLKKVENIFLENMFEEWQKKKNKEENKLQTTIEECERLSKKLEDGYAQMKDVQRSEKESQSLASTQAVIQEELALERKRNAALELELREEREENKVLRNRIMKMERSNAAAELEISEQIRQLEASMTKLKLSKDYYKQKWLQLIREVNKLSPGGDDD